MQVSVRLNTARALVILGALISASLPTQAGTPATMQTADLQKDYPASLVISQSLTPEEQALVSPSLVTVHLKDRQRHEVVRAAAAQAKVRVVGPLAENLATTQIAPITLDLDRQPL